MIKFAPEPESTIQNGQIKFYFNESEGKTLYIHFQTTFDEMVMEQFLLERLAKTSMDSKDDHQIQEKRNGKRRNSTVHSLLTIVRSKFAQILLFAIQICHIIVLVEPNNVFDTSYLSIFKALKVIRYLNWSVQSLIQYLNTETDCYLSICLFQRATCLEILAKDPEKLKFWCTNRERGPIMLPAFHILLRKDSKRV